MMITWTDTQLWGLVMVIFALCLVLVVVAVVVFVLLIANRMTSMMTTARDMVVNQGKLVDKLTTLLMSRDPMTYQALRAGDSLVGYDEATKTDPIEETQDGEEPYGPDGPVGDLDAGDPFIAGSLYGRD
jgi:ABC-type siderophore export system fused ATPase/permease subunit